MLFGTCGCYCCALPKNFRFNANISFKDEKTYPPSSEQLTELTGLIYVLRATIDSNNPRVRFEKLDIQKKSDLLHGKNGDGQIFPLSGSESTPVLDSINLKKQGFTKCHVNKYAVCAEVESVELDDMGVIGPWAFDKHIGCYCCNCYNEHAASGTVAPTGAPSGQLYCPEGGTFPTPCASGRGGGIITKVSSTEKAKYRLYWLKVPKKNPTDEQYYILAIPIYIQSSHCKFPTGLAGGDIKITFWKKKDYMDFNDEIDGKLPPRPCPYYDEKPAGTGDGDDYNKELEKLDISIDVPVGKDGSGGKLKILWAYEATDTRLKGNGWYEKRQFYTVVDNTCPTGTPNTPFANCAPCPCHPYDLPPQQKDPDTPQYHERKYFARKYNLPLWWQQPSGISWPMDSGLFMEDCNPASPTEIKPVGDCCCCCEKCQKRIIIGFNLSDSITDTQDLTSFKCSASYGDCTKWQLIARRTEPVYSYYPRVMTEGIIRCSGTGTTPCMVGLPDKWGNHLTNKGYRSWYELWVMCQTDCKNCKTISFDTNDECPPYTAS